VRPTLQVRKGQILFKTEAVRAVIGHDRVLIIKTRPGQVSGGGGWGTVCTALAPEGPPRIAL